ncbi:MAG: NAD-dependent epimerase/dehydratase family protein, partial [Nitrospinota bacterium]
MRIFITGGGGFLGRYIVRMLVKRGDQVTTFSRNRYEHLSSLDVKQVVGDINDYDKLSHELRHHDAIIHLASKVGIWGDYDSYRKVNLDGTMNVIKAALECEIEKVVYTSTPSVVFDGKPHSAIDERKGYSKKFYCAYQKSKMLAEEAILLANSANLATVAIRPHLVWGPEDNNLIPRLIARAKA